MSNNNFTDINCYLIIVARLDAANKQLADAVAKYEAENQLLLGVAIAAQSVASYDGDLMDNDGGDVLGKLDRALRQVNDHFAGKPVTPADSDPDPMADAARQLHDALATSREVAEKRISSQYWKARAAMEKFALVMARHETEME